MNKVKFAALNKGGIIGKIIGVFAGFVRVSLILYPIKSIGFSNNWYI